MITYDLTDKTAVVLLEKYSRLRTGIDSLFERVAGIRHGMNQRHPATAQCNAWTFTRWR